MPNAFPPQTNSNRFNFIMHAGKISPGDPRWYYVQDGGGSVNSAGFVGSCSGQVIGRILYDPIMKRWNFVLDELRFANLAIDGVGALTIQNFINSLALPTAVNPLV